jgi:hypothetical protein
MTSGRLVMLLLKSLEVALLPQVGIVWEIEPLPKKYEREILSF